MERSIEDIWKAGFIDDEALVAPRLNNLYEQKSYHLIDRMQRMYRMNVQMIAVFALACLIGYTFMGIPVVGGILFVLMGGLGLFAERHRRQMKAIDKGENSYEYLIAFDRFLKGMGKVYTRINRFFYPAVVLAAFLGICYMPGAEKTLAKLLEKFPDMVVVYGIPLWWAVAVGTLALLMGIFAGRIYRFDIRLVYGRVMDRLEELIRDMETLR